MTTTLYVIYFIAAFGLLVFGAWITFRGVRFMLTKYDWKKSPQGDMDAMPLVSSDFSVNRMLTSLNTIVDQASSSDVQQAPTPEEAGAGPEVEPPVEPPVEPGGGQTGVTTTESKGSTLEGVAKIIEALPNLLKADFGPIVVVCFTGLVVMGAGFTILIMVLKAVTT